jgi:hypothetical protein
MLCLCSWLCLNFLPRFCVFSHVVVPAHPWNVVVLRTYCSSRHPPLSCLSFFRYVGLHFEFVMYCSSISKLSGFYLRDLFVFNTLFSVSFIIFTLRVYRLYNIFLFFLIVFHYYCCSVTVILGQQIHFSLIILLKFWFVNSHMLFLLFIQWLVIIILLPDYIFQHIIHMHVNLLQYHVNSWFINPILHYFDLCTNFSIFILLFFNRRSLSTYLFASFQTAIHFISYVFHHIIRLCLHVGNISGGNHILRENSCANHGKKVV